jgi:hypothetical protein
MKELTSLSGDGVVATLYKSDARRFHVRFSLGGVKSPFFELVRATTREAAESQLSVLFTLHRALHVLSSSEGGCYGTN